MQCQRCESTRIQRDYDNSNPVVRLMGMRKVLCNNCGLVFRTFDPLNKLSRKPAKREGNLLNCRRGPRYRAHLPTAISLIDRPPKDGKATYSESSNGHCETLNRFGMGVSLVGTRFSEEELSLGRLLFVRIHLPDATIEAVVSIVNHHRFGKDKKRKWFLGVKIQQISDASKRDLDAYLAKRAHEEPLILMD